MTYPKNRRLTVAQRHFVRTQAAQVAAGDGEDAEPTDAQRMMAAALWEDRRALKAIKSIDRKIARKRDLLPKYDAYIAGVLEGDSGEPDEVLMTVLLWRFDARDLDGGLAIADYALAHGLTTPDRYERDTPTIVAEEVAEQILAILDERRDTDQDGTAPAKLVQWAERAHMLSCDADIHDQVRAKLHKARGYALRADGHEPPALEALREALRLNPQVGVKKSIERLERQIAKQQQADATGAA